MSTPSTTRLILTALEKGACTVCDMTLTFERAAEIAESAHAGQYDKIGRPYITHPRRVAVRAVALATYHQLGLDLEEVRMVAILHDVVEDTSVTLEDLAAAGASEGVLRALRLLTHAHGEPYQEYVERIATDLLALIVKLADVMDNSDPDRLSLLPVAVRERLERKYARARALLKVRLAEA